MAAKTLKNTGINVKGINETDEILAKVSEYCRKAGVYPHMVVNACYSERLHVAQVAQIIPPQEGTTAWDECRMNLYLWNDQSRVTTCFFPGEYVWPGRLIVQEALRRALDHYDEVRVTSEYTQRYAVLRPSGGNHSEAGSVLFVDEDGKGVREPVAQDLLPQKLNAWLMSDPVKVGDFFVEKINQGDRDCSVIGIARTRYRIEFDMPKCVQQGWRTGILVAGKLFYRATN